MMRRRRLLLTAAGLLTVLGSSLSLDPARASSAASIDDVGWWWRLQANPAVPLPPPPGVAEDQLLVQGAPDGAVAIAAIAATLAEGEGMPRLTLAVAEGGDGAPPEAVLLACQAGSSWAGGPAKPWAEKPPPACEAGAAEGEQSEDGTSWTFDLSSLQFTDQVNVVLVPGVVEGQPEGANGSTFSVTFAAPTPESIEAEPGVEAPPLDLSSDFASGSYDAGSTSDTSFSSPSFGSGSSSFAPVAALPEGEQGLTPVAPSVQARQPVLPAVAAVDPRSPYARAVGVVLLLAGGAAAYLATKKTPLVGPDGVPGGLAQWARPRWGAPPPLRG